MATSKHLVAASFSCGYLTCLAAHADGLTVGSPAPHDVALSLDESRGGRLEWLCGVESEGRSSSVEIKTASPTYSAEPNSGVGGDRFEQGFSSPKNPGNAGSCITGKLHPEL